jgi:HD-GYP domain-containing protein (c-di-GMP phosphodiesterase class II)
MQFALLSTVKHRAAVGVPLPFNVYNADRTLLLATGKSIDSTDQLLSLMDRGVLIDLDEMLSPMDVARRAPPTMLPAIWAESRERIVSAMREPLSPGFTARLDDAIGPVQALVERDPDLAILQLLRQDSQTRREYGIQHSMRASVIALLIASRLKWSGEQCNLAIKCALTMNLAMHELQGALAASGAEPDAAQRREIITHPTRSRAMLEAAGVTDTAWLRAVEEHHEQPDGRGYPGGRSDVCDVASLVRCADIYTATLGERRGREPLSSDRAIRRIYMSEPDSIFAAALVKELGLYPPGTFVSLTSGEAAIVVRRGPTITTPIVAAMTNRYRQPLPQPVRRDTSQPGQAIAGVIPARDLPVQLKPQSMAAILAI